MKRVFADTACWMALLSARHQLHSRALEASTQLKDVHIVTSDWVLTELLNGLADSGSEMRSAAAATAVALQSDSGVTVVPQTRQAFTASLNLYRERSDKGWSLTDCASFLTIRELGITAALTSDKHFEQAGCTALLR
jgi:predicted nucleic acid-binding protein